MVQVYVTLVRFLMQDAIGYAQSLAPWLIMGTFVSLLHSAKAMIDLAGFKELLQTPGKKVVITTHHKPDADALGSSLALAAALKKLKHEVYVISPSDYPKFLNWMQGEKEVIQYDAPQNTSRCHDLVNAADIIFSLDYSALNRINDLGPIVGVAPGIKAMVDHHLEPEGFADFMFWDTKAAATCELIYDLLVQLDWENLIDHEVADCLYAGIMTDTGSFRHPSTTAKVHTTIARLIELGADNHRVHKLIYDTNSEDRLRFLGYVLSQKMQVLPQYHTAYIALTKGELEQFKSKTGDTEGFVNYALGIEGVRLAAIIVDRTEAVKISFRSTGSFSVNDFARAHFQGGGHRNAAGGKSLKTLEQTVQDFLDLLPQYQEALSQQV